MSLLFCYENFQHSIELFSAENVFFSGVSADYPIYAIIFGRFTEKFYLWLTAMRNSMIMPIP